MIAPVQSAPVFFFEICLFLSISTSWFARSISTCMHNSHYSWFARNEMSDFCAGAWQDQSALFSSFYKCWLLWRYHNWHVCKFRAEGPMSQLLADAGATCLLVHAIENENRTSTMSNRKVQDQKQHAAILPKLQHLDETPLFRWNPSIWVKPQY